MRQLASSWATTGDSIATIADWMEAFAACVRDIDYEAGRAMFAGDVVGYGTWTKRMCGLDALVRGQWRNVWGRTTGFCFALDQLDASIDGDMAWAGAPWSSEGICADGTRFPRSGRATFVFRRDGDRWLAVHSHFSSDPTGTL